jgi:eukaryotic-like serine/threonine-protein kinase
MGGGAARLVVGRYAIYDPIASGGMATVHFGRLLGPVGFTRPVAIKRLLPQFARDPDFVAMFVDEARVAARLHHPNVVGTIDVVATQAELFLVMDYVEGDSLARLCAAGPVPPPIAVAIAAGVLRGLHAAHEAKGPNGEPLDIVHRDVSPHNVLVGIDGMARVADFGVAKARGRMQATREGQLKGKPAYLAPEQLRGTVSRRTDIFAASIVLWEMLKGARLFQGASDADSVARVRSAPIPSLCEACPHVPPALEQAVLRGLERDPERRYATAREMAAALEDALTPATSVEVGEWVERTAAPALARSADALRAIERTFRGDIDPSAREQGTPPALTGEPTRAITGLAAPPAARKRGARRPVLLGATLAIGLLVAVAALARSKSPAAIPTSPEAPPHAAEGNGEPAEIDLEATAAPRSDSPTPAPCATVAVPPAPRAPRGGRHAVAPKRVDCTPTYTVDDHGVRRYKPECFE